MIHFSSPLAKRRTLLHGVLGCALNAALLPRAHAQNDASWPSRPLRLVVGFPAGSTPDMAARALADPLAHVLGQPVYVDNRTGASGNIAASQVARASDDHTLGVLINGNLTTARLLDPTLSFDPARDFAPLSLLTTAPLVLVAPPGAPAGAAFFAAAARQGSRWSYGSVGIGSVGHLGMEWLKSRVRGVAAVHVPFRSNPDIVNALLAGDIQLALVPPGIAMPQVHAGKLQAIGLSSGRSALVPDVAPLADAGVRDFQLEVWTALVGPARLSAPAQVRLGREVPALLRDAATRQKLLNQGWQAVGSAPQALALRMHDEAAAMGAIIARQGIKPE